MDPVTPRLVATDLDGTLVRKDGTVSPYTREVLAALDARGVPVIFVTGRPLRWTTPVFEHVGSHGLAIVSNGALVWDVAEEVPRMSRALEGEASLEVASRIRRRCPDRSSAPSGWTASPSSRPSRWDRRTHPTWSSPS